MNNNFLYCSLCKNKYSLSTPIWQCECGNFLDIEFNAKINTKNIKKVESTLWRYREAIPIEKDSNISTLGEGFTPIIKSKIDNKELLIKLEHHSPTGSFKDRGASVLISKIKELGINEIIEDSSGNAGAAISAYSANANISCKINVPEQTSSSKVFQIKAFGAETNLIAGTRDDVAEATLKEAKNIFYASHTWNPFFFQGTKTFAYEIWEQLKGSIPDALLIPSGNGTLFIGAYIGFNDLIKNNLITKMPKLIAVQAENTSPLFNLFNNSTQNIFKNTLAEGIAISKPLRSQQMIDIINKTKGTVITVSEQEIKSALKTANKMGLFIEPTSATAFAAFKKYKSKCPETVLIPVTGHGLKRIDVLSKLDF